MILSKRLPAPSLSFSILQKFVVPVAVAATGLAVAIVGALLVGTGGGTDSINLFVDGTLSGNSSNFLGRPSPSYSPSLPGLR